jgi:phosphopantothenoylcysteine decarboxylase / phosphopantothenate---cysteine ligase
MRVLITAGPTREPIDAVRYIGNRSSGRMGAALVEASLRAGHETTLIAGPVSIEMPAGARRIDVETSSQMLEAVLREFPGHDLLIMTAAVSDFRPAQSTSGKMPRLGTLNLELEATEDIVARAGMLKRPDQRTVGFSLESEADLGRARRKLMEKRLDLIVYNPTETIASQRIEPILLYPDGHSEKLPSRPKTDFADILLQWSAGLFPAGGH